MHLQMDHRLNEQQRKRAMNRLGFARRWISDDRPYDWGAVLREGSLNVFDLRMQTMSPAEALKLCLVVTDLIRRTRNGVNKVVVFDEDHEYLDCKELVGEFENAITQIRHDGLSFVLHLRIDDPEVVDELRTMAQDEALQTTKTTIPPRRESGRRGSVPTPGWFVRS
jgi:hypothetical protein